MCAFCGVDFDAVERDFIENAVNCAQGAYIAAEGAVDHNCRKQRYYEDRKFPAEDEACRSPHGRIQKYERDSPFQSAHRADPLAEPGVSKACDIHNEHGKENHEDAEKNEAQPAQALFSRQAADFFYKGNFKKQILNQAEGTQKTADKAAEKSPENYKKTCNVH